MTKKFDNQSAFTTDASQYVFNHLQEQIKKDYSDYDWYHLMNEYMRNHGYTLVELESENDEDESEDLSFPESHNMIDSVLENR